MKLIIHFFVLFIFCFLSVAKGQTPVTFNTKTDFTTGSNPQSVSIGDINGDGKPDLVVANINSSTVSVFLNTTTPGAATPTFDTRTDFTTASSPLSVSIVDLNGDGKPDLVVTNGSSGSVSVLLNLTIVGGFSPAFAFHTDFTTGTGPNFISISDFNGDGKPDLAVTNGSSNSVSVFLNTTTLGSAIPAFSVKTDFTTGTTPESISICDLNGDGKPDLAITNFSSNSVSILLNTTVSGAATPTFSAKTDFNTGASPRSVYAEDLNGDGKPDLVVANANAASISVLLNTTTPGAVTPSFSAKTDFTVGTGPFSVFIKDLNGDGKPDVAAVNFTSNSVSVLLNIMAPGDVTPSFLPKTDFTTGTDPNFVSISDLNGDGKPDLATANGGNNSVSVLLNTSILGGAVPSFTSKIDIVTGNTPQYVSIGDFNGDGKPDLAVANIDADNFSVFLNISILGSGDLKFSARTDFTTGSSPRSVSIGDFNGDGKLDIAVPNGNSSSVSVFLNSSTPGAAVPTFYAKADFATGITPTSVSICDFNGDGKPDLAVANFSSNNISVFFNTTIPGAKTATFSAKTDFTTETGPSFVSIGDFNGDRKPDIAVTNGISNSVSVFLNTTGPGVATPSFSAKTDFAAGAGPFSVFIKDLNGDGKPDIAVANINSNNISVFINTTTPGAATPTFSAKTDFIAGLGATSVFIRDLNGDGKPDIAVANFGTSSVSVLFSTTTPGVATPTFSSKTDFTAGADPSSVSIGDLNGDGKPDLVVANSGSNSVSILLNTIVTGIEEVNNFIPSDFTLKQNYPNPFNPSTNISFSILGESFVTLKIYDILGKEVTQLVNQQLKTGSYNFSFDAANLTSGVYFYRLTAISRAGNFIDTKKMVLVK